MRWPKKWCHSLITLPVLPLLFLPGPGCQINEEWRVSECMCVWAAGGRDRERVSESWVIDRKKLLAGSILSHSVLMTCLNSYWYHALSAIHCTVSQSSTYWSWTAMIGHCREVWRTLTWGNLLRICLWSHSVVRSVTRWYVWVTGFLKHEVKVMSHARVAPALQGCGHQTFINTTNRHQSRDH